MTVGIEFKILTLVSEVLFESNWLILNFSSPIFHLFFTLLGYTGLLLVLENSKHSFIRAFAFASVVIFQILA